jgi:hypothetical protein
VGQKRGALSLVSKIQELSGGKISGSGKESRDYSSKDLLRWPRDTFYPQKLALTSPTSSGRSVGTVGSQNIATELLKVVKFFLK